MVLWRVYVAACPSCLRHLLLGVDNICVFYLSPSPLTVAHRIFHPSFFMALFRCQDFPSFHSPTQCNFVSSQEYLFDLEVFFSCSFLSLSIKLILPDARQIISWIEVSPCCFLMQLWIVVSVFLPLTYFFQCWSTECSFYLTCYCFSVFLRHLAFSLAVISTNFLLWFSLLQNPKWHWPSLLPSGCLIHSTCMCFVPFDRAESNLWWEMWHDKL